MHMDLSLYLLVRPILSKAAKYSQSQNLDFQFLQGKKLKKQKKMSLNTERLVLQSLETKIPNQIDTLENHTRGFL